MATIFIQASVPVVVGVALVCNSMRKNIKKRKLRAIEVARSRERFKFFANGA